MKVFRFPQILMSVPWEHPHVVKIVPTNIVPMVNTPAHAMMVMNLMKIKRIAKVSFS